MPGEPDRTNTVEIVDVAGLAAGRYALRVTAVNVPASPQALEKAAWVRTSIGRNTASEQTNSA